MTYRPIERVIAPGQPHFVGDGFRVHNFIPHGASVSMERMSPFIMLDYNSKWEVPPVKAPLGVGVHPHRGFETVTIAYKGKVEHHDSSGGGGVIGEGGRPDRVRRYYGGKPGHGYPAPIADGAAPLTLRKEPPAPVAMVMGQRRRRRLPPAPPRVGLWMH